MGEKLWDKMFICFKCKNHGYKLLVCKRCNVINKLEKSNMYLQVETKEEKGEAIREYKSFLRGSGAFCGAHKKELLESFKKVLNDEQ